MVVWTLHMQDKTLRDMRPEFNVEFKVDGRWSQSTILKKLSEACERASIEAGFMLAINRHTGPNGWPLQIPAHGASRKFGDVLVRWRREGSGHSSHESWMATRWVDGTPKHNALKFGFDEEENAHTARIVNKNGATIAGGSGPTREMALEAALADWSNWPY